MDDISFWLYILFGLIYFIARALKKKGQPDTPSTDTENAPPSRRAGRSKTFEELLQEFTEGKESVKEEVREQEQEVEDFREVREVKQTDDVKRRVEKEVSTATLFEEGTTRSFSDEESRRVYEESIKKAEGATLDYGRDEDFKSSIKSRSHHQEEGNAVASEIKDMLSNPDDAKKAVILGEILNRKY